MSGKAAITRPARSFPAAAAILAERDPVLHRLIAQAGPPPLPPPAENHFAALVRAIVYQQLAGAAAAAIFGRLTTVLGGSSRRSICCRCRTPRCARPACPAGRQRTCGTWQPRRSTARSRSTRPSCGPRPTRR